MIDLARTPHVIFRCSECANYLAGSYYTDEYGSTQVSIAPCEVCIHNAHAGELTLDKSKITDIMSICRSILNE